MPDTASPGAQPTHTTAPSDFTIPRSFSPTHSPVGRLIRRRSGDRLRGEALYLFIVTMAVVGWLLAGFAAWALLADRITSDPTGPVALAFLAVQIAGPVLGFLVAGVGFRPEIHIRVGEGRLTIDQGSDRFVMPLDDRVTVRPLDAVTYHRGLRRFETTHPFINRPVDSVLVVTSDATHFVLGLEPEESAALVGLLKPAITPPPERADSPASPRDRTHSVLSDATDSDTT